MFLLPPVCGIPGSQHSALHLVLGICLYESDKKRGIQGDTDKDGDNHNVHVWSGRHPRCVPGVGVFGEERKEEGECARQGSESREWQSVACKPHIICVEMAPET